MTASGNHTDNTVGVRLSGKVVLGGTAVVSPEANLTGNNTIANNTYGVWVHGPTVDPTPGAFWMWWNDVRGNAQQGFHVEGDPQPRWESGAFFHAYCNWWNDDSGPFDPTPDSPDSNPGSGQPVSDWFWYRELNPPPPPYVPRGWLNRTATDPLAACNGGV